MPAASSVWRARPATPDDEGRVTAFLEEHHADVVARLGRLEDARRAPKLLVEDAGAIVGVLAYLVDGDACEVLTLHAATRQRGAGTALLDAIGGLASARGCARLWLVTTNDNTDALRFYQRRGFRLARIDAGAVDRARATIKPSIPSVGEHGIPIRDELVLERMLPSSGGQGATPDPFSRDEGRSVFGSVADVYTAARPDYPDRVYDILRARCGLAPSSRVVEIGAGTGQATRRLVQAGAFVVAVEPARALADQLRARVTPTERLEVIVGAFEDVHLPRSAFDLVTVATAFHWLDPARALPKIASVLRPGGWLALWWNVFGDPELPDPFHDATHTLLRDLAPSPSAGAGGTPYALDVPARIAELTDSGFRDAEHEAIRWTLRLDAEQARRLYGTYSNIARLPIARKRAILDDIERIVNDEFSGHVERRMVTPIYTAHR